MSFGDEITADSTEESAAVGSTVTLSCSYSSANSLQWYRQYPRSAPQFLVLIIESVKETKISDVDPRFSTKVRKEKSSYKRNQTCGSDHLLCCCIRLCSVLLRSDAHSHRKHINTVQKPDTDECVKKIFDWYMRQIWCDLSQRVLWKRWGLKQWYLMWSS